MRSFLNLICLAECGPMVFVCLSVIRLDVVKPFELRNDSLDRKKTSQLCIRAQFSLRATKWRQCAITKCLSWNSVKCRILRFSRAIQETNPYELWQWSIKEVVYKSSELQLILSNSAQRREHVLIYLTFTVKEPSHFVVVVEFIQLCGRKTK